MTTKHTPAPWHVEWAMIQGGDGHTIHDATGYPELGRIAAVYFHDDHDGETRANALLIASAPDLLEALLLAERLLVPSEDFIGKELAVIRAAIAKATGV